MNCYRIKLVAKDYTDLVISDSLTNSIELICKIKDVREHQIFEITDLGEVILPDKITERSSE